MKKIIVLALVILAGASFNAAFADKKKDKKNVQQQEQPAAPLSLNTRIDSISYAAGMSYTQGLEQYLQQQYQVDTTYLNHVALGIKEGIGKSKDPKFIAYTAGAMLAQMIENRILPNVQKQFEGTKDSIDTKMFVQGFVASLLRDHSYFNTETAQNTFEMRLNEDKAVRDSAYKKVNDTWLAENAKKEGVKTTDDGLQYKVITAGNGPIPQPTDKVKVKYEGKMIDGTVFDSSYKRDPQTTTFQCNQVIKGWTEALTMMPVGSKWELYIPQQLAYGGRQAGQIKPYSALIFTVELVDIEKPAPKAETTTKATTTSTTKANSKSKSSRRRK